MGMSFSRVLDEYLRLREDDEAPAIDVVKCRTALDRFFLDQQRAETPVFHPYGLKKIGRPRGQKISDEAQRERKRASDKAWAERNKDKIHASRQRYYWANKAKLLARQKLLRQERAARLKAKDQASLP